jgi:predicted DNA-binding transcriptional regulator YafY
MHKQKIIEAIQNQKWLRITFRRERDDQYVTRIVAPYDIFPQESEKYHKERYRLIGYTKAHEDYRPGVISLYLDNIIKVSETEEHFDGPKIRRLINPKEPPYIPRDW